MKTQTGAAACEANHMGRGVTMKLNAILFALFLTFITLLFSGASYGFKQADLDKLLATRQCAFCDLKAARLADMSLPGTRLSGAILSDAELTDADLSQGNLRNAMLARANLSRANLSGADLSRANLSHALLSHANLSHAKLLGADLPNADLSDADLSDADLSRADLSGADLSHANLFGTILSGAHWADGTKCSDDSIGSCTKAPPLPSTGGMF